MLLTKAIGTMLRSKVIRFHLGRGMRMMVAVTVAAMVISIRKPLQASCHVKRFHTMRGTEVDDVPFLNHPHTGKLQQEATT